MARVTGADPMALAAVIRGAIAEGVSVEALQKVHVPVLAQRRADVENQKTGRIVAAIPTARSAACEGGHYSTPFQPSFHQEVIDFFEEQWRTRRTRYGNKP